MELREVKGEEKEYDYCLRCRRRLKNPEARKIGYGPICEKKMRSTGNRRLFTIK